MPNVRVERRERGKAYYRESGILETYLLGDRKQKLEDLNRMYFKLLAYRKKYYKYPTILLARVERLRVEFEKM